MFVAEDSSDDESSLSEESSTDCEESSTDGEDDKSFPFTMSSLDSDVDIPESSLHSLAPQSQRIGFFRFFSRIPRMRLALVEFVASSTDASSVTNRLSSSIDALLAEQRERILQQFSLDRSDSALSRFLRELSDRHDLASRKMGDRHDIASEKLQREIRNVVKKFSLNEESSALSCLVRNVEVAQSTIHEEFSLDSDRSSPSHHCLYD